MQMKNPEETEIDIVRREIGNAVRQDGNFIFLKFSQLTD